MMLSDSIDLAKQPPLTAHDLMWQRKVRLDTLNAELQQKKCEHDQLTAERDQLLQGRQDTVMSPIAPTWTSALFGSPATEMATCNVARTNLLL